ncbi:hypothetical protein [Gilliamella sp. Imp1-1]|uniref:hypothetical protein n=1 Tax=Gilliamella sp. Imp1-1 TaxID=3120248 RepID=UPI000461A463|nr:hypothetical protein [Gilliamella apicola]KDN09342.1 hypothetical protein GAPWKB30_2059 [Gilliamella apicola]OCG56009.1 hypothetical protein A9G38_10690 [Gilliamella apicola]
MNLFALMKSNVGIPILRISTDAKSQKALKVIFNDQKALFDTHYDNEIEFCAGYTPKYSEIFVINDFDNGIEDMHAAIKTPTSIDSWNPKKVPIENIKCLFTGNARDRTILLQTFDKKQVLDITKSFIFSNDVFKMSTTVGFNITDKLTAIIEDKKLKFKSLQNTRKIFNMDKYFREATDNELKSFVEHCKFKVSEEFDIIKIADTEIRTKVTLLNKLDSLSEDINKIKQAAENVNFKLKTEVTSGGEEKILIPIVKKELKALLSFLNEDIFISDITKTTYKSNSKRKFTT